jgi:archaellum biogenesis ATPase FlaH
MQETEVKLIMMSEVPAEKVSWLWYPYIPYGKITIVQGNPGDGKTTFILAVTALLTTGRSMPESDIPTEPITVIYQTAEDGLSDTIKPKLVEAGADCTKVAVIDKSIQPLSLLDGRLEKAIRQINARLLILDPLQAYLGEDIDMHRANEVRPIFKQLAGVAERTGCAIVIIGHMNKMNRIKGLYRGLGSIDIAAAASSVLLVGRCRKSPSIRVMAHLKSSLAPEGKSIGFELDEITGFRWVGHYDITADELLSGSHKIEEGQTKQAQAEIMLYEILYNGAVPCSDIYTIIAKQNISRRTVENAKKVWMVCVTSWYGQRTHQKSTVL